MGAVGWENRKEKRDGWNGVSRGREREIEKGGIEKKRRGRERERRRRTNGKGGAYKEEQKDEG